MISELEMQIEKVRESRQASGYYSGLVNLELQKFELDHAALIANMNLEKARVPVEEAKLRELTLEEVARHTRKNVGEFTATPKLDTSEFEAGIDKMQDKLWKLQVEQRLAAIEKHIAEGQ